MAELAVQAALVLVEIILPLVRSRNSDKNLQNIDVQTMQDWHLWLKAFVDDNRQHQGNRMHQVQMGKVRDIAYDIEDVLDEIVLHAPPYTFHSHRITRTLHNQAHNILHGFPMKDISEKMKKIDKDIKFMKELFAPAPNSQWQASSSSSSSTPARHRVSPLLQDDEMVGYEEPKREFMRQLIDGGTRVVTFAVHGPGGSGKTTFVKNVFWKQEIRGRFDCHAWVHVSNHCDVEKLLVNMLKQLCGSRKEPYPVDDGLPTSQKLQRYLAGKRYIIALDDVWKKEDWDHMKNALPDTNRGSRIIVTTRSSNLASTCASSSQHLYSLGNLEWLQGWKLFCTKAFSDENGECPCDLKDSSVKIVKRCEGLPLAIVAVAGALSHIPRRPNEWEKFHNNLGGEIRQGSNLSVIDDVLLPSYLDLHTSLKCCFLYFSIFPEDQSVKRMRLVRLWVAEQFAIETEYKTAEEVAEEYLDELIQRNLVHVSDWDFDGRPRNCRVLNLILKFINEKCKDENFASIATQNRPDQKIRRLSIHNDCANFPRDKDLGGVRSLVLLTSKSLSDLGIDLSKLKRLRVLDAQGAPLRVFPKDIARLTLIKHLSFRDTRIKKIPDSIKKLSYLETLDLKQTDVVELPKEISFLHNLRHLFVYKYNVKNYVEFDSVQGATVFKGIKNLTNLQDLSLVKVDKSGDILKDLIKLTRLRKLGLVDLKEIHGEDLCRAVESMAKLTTLDLRAATKDNFLELGSIKTPPQTLQHLYLKGRLSEFPGWISSLDNLLKIGLMWCKLKTSSLAVLEHLPHLMELQMVDCYTGKELEFSARGFKKLTSILIEELNELHTIEIQGGAMPQLKQISIRRCPQLKLCPLGMECLTQLEELTLYDMHQELVSRLRANGEDRESVQRVPVIHSFTLVDQSWSFENLSASFTD